MSAHPLFAAMNVPSRGTAAVLLSSAVGMPGGVVGSGARRRSVQVASSAEGREARVLVVEPDVRSRSLLDAGLARAGFDVTSVDNAEAALRELVHNPELPGLVVAEAELAGVDGFAFCSSLRADVRTAHVPVILLAQKPEAIHRELIGGVGADDYLPKPLFVQDVVTLARLRAGRASFETQLGANTERISLTALLRVLLSGVRSGRVELAGGRGRLTFHGGYVVDAAFDGMTGEPSLRRMLALAEGDYRVTFAPVFVDGGIRVSLRVLVEQLLPAARHFGEVRLQAVPLDAARGKAHNV